MIRSSSYFQRDLQPEMMDRDDLPRADHLQALAGLARLNFFTGVAGDLYSSIRKVALLDRSKTIRLLDVASGSADLPIAWAVRARREGIKLDITTLDISEVAIEEQQRRASARGVRVRSIQQDCTTDPIPEGFDVITNSLFMHHLDEVNVVALIRRMYRSARSRVLICDLERSRLNLGLVRIGSRLVSRSNVVHHDARLSVRGAFNVAEFKRLAENATGQSVRVRRLLPCRMLIGLVPDSGPHQPQR